MPCRLIPAALLIAALFIPGCIAVGGKTQSTPPTLGRQLIDLKTAYEQGAMSETEYQQAKAQLIIDAPSVAQR
jgi:hypothetical protein